MNNKLLKIRVRIDDKEVEVSYPITERSVVGYDSGTLVSAVKAIKDIVDHLTKDK